MNFMDDVEGSRIMVELKYCERCGGLWLRPVNTDGVYCTPCRTCLATLPDPGKAPVRKARRRRKPINQTTQVKTTHIPCLQGVVAGEAWA
jgi:hypothetical protein